MRRGFSLSCQVRHRKTVLPILQETKERPEIEIPPKIIPADYVSNITIKISINQLGNDYCIPSDQQFLANFQFELEEQNQENFFKKRARRDDII